MAGLGTSCGGQGQGHSASCPAHGLSLSRLPPAQKLTGLEGGHAELAQQLAHAAGRLAVRLACIVHQLRQTGEGVTGRAWRGRDAAQQERLAVPLMFAVSSSNGNCNGDVD